MKWNSDNFRSKEDSNQWIFSYADMMTLLLGFFVILFSLSNIDNSKFNAFADKISESLKNTKVKQKSQQEPTKAIPKEKVKSHALDVLLAMMNIGSSQDDGINRIRKLQQSQNDSSVAKEMIMSSFSEEEKILLDDIKAKLTPDQRSVEIVLPQAPLFSTGSYALNDSAVQIVESVASKLIKVKDLVKIKVIGHTDSRAPRNPDAKSDNFTLSASRATAVARVLISKGLDPQKMEVSGMGSLQPLYPEKDSRGNWIEENMRANRRVHIYLMRKEI